MNRNGIRDPKNLTIEAIAFDTHRFVKHMTESEFSENQAETLTELRVALSDANLATKMDLEIYRRELKSNLEIYRRELTMNLEIYRLEIKLELEKFNSDIKKWMSAALIVQGVLVVALIKIL